MPDPAATTIERRTGHSSRYIGLCLCLTMPNGMLSTPVASTKRVTTCMTVKLHARGTLSSPQHSQVVLLLRRCVLVHVRIVLDRPEASSCTVFCGRNDSNQPSVFHLPAGRRQIPANMPGRDSLLHSTAIVRASSGGIRRESQLDGRCTAADRLASVGGSCTEGTCNVQHTCMHICPVLCLAVIAQYNEATLKQHETRGLWMCGAFAVVSSVITSGAQNLGFDWEVRTVC
jgi:hypothetical protein